LKPSSRKCPPRSGGEQDIVVDDRRRDVVAADRRLRANRDVGRQRIAAGGRDPPLHALGQKDEILQRDDVPDLAPLARGDADADAVVVAAGDRIAEVALGARARAPKVGGLVERPGEEAALLEIADRAGVVAGS
jgi:hypothetical protein